MGETNWIDGKAPGRDRLRVKLRHGEHAYGCTFRKAEPAGVTDAFTPTTELPEDLFEVRIAGRDQGIAAGQFAVFYDEDECLGCGIIQ